MKGRSDVPAMRLEVLRRLVSKFQRPPALMFVNMFPDFRAESDTIEWESQTGGRRMAPFKGPGQLTPRGYIGGAKPHSARAAFWGEKLYFDEEFLNNLRKPGTENVHQTAKATLAREMLNLTNRSYRRKEWMFAKMLGSGSFSYKTKDNRVTAVDYALPDTHIVTNGATKSWADGEKKDIIDDFITGVGTIQDDCAGTNIQAIMNRNTFKYMARDDDIVGLLKQSAFAKGDLYGGKVHKVIGANPQIVNSLLPTDDISVYDEVYEVEATLTAAVTGDSTTEIYVDNASDMEVGARLKLIDTSEDNSYEYVTISAVDEASGKVTVAAAPENSYKAGEDMATMVQFYVPDDYVIFIARNVDDGPIAEYMMAPYGNERVWGMKIDSWPEIEPDGYFVRVQDKGLPVLYHRDAVYILKVIP
jgi:hypothetical protein